MNYLNKFKPPEDMRENILELLRDPKNIKNLLLKPEKIKELIIEPEKEEEENMESIVENRYNRQELIEGWDQEKINNAYIAVIGSGTLANFTAASLVSLGFGNVELYDNKKTEDAESEEFLLKLTDTNESKVESLEGILSKINPLVNVKGIHAKIDSKLMASLLGKPKLIIDTTNESITKKTVMEYARKNRIPVIFASADANKGSIMVNMPRDRKKRIDDFKSYEDKTQGAIPSEILGGIITEEARKIIMPFNRNDKPLEKLVYSAASPSRFSERNEKTITEGSLKDKSVFVIGAGALGNFVGLGLALSGFENVDILDYDIVETTNLNRQLLFYDSVNENKAESLAEKMKMINPKMEVEGIDKKLDEKFSSYFRLKKNRPDLIMDCVDNFYTRAIANYLSVKYKIPLISGGTNPSSGQVVSYKPGYSACLDCKLSVDKAYAKEKTSHSCIHATEPSVIMTNEIIGGMMVAEARAVLDPENYGEPVKKMIKYDSNSKARAGLVGGDKPCDCKRGTIKQWADELIKKYKN